MEEQHDYRRVEEIAKIFGVTVRRVQQLTQEGIIQSTKQPGVNGRVYDLIPTCTNYIAHLAAKANGKRGVTDEEAKLKEQKLKAEVALRESQGELHRIRTEIAAGKYISIDEVRIDYARFFVTFKKFATSLPSRIGGMLSGILDPVEARRIEKDLSAEIVSLIDSFVVAGIAEPRIVKETLKNAEQEEQLEIATDEN